MIFANIGTQTDTTSQLINTILTNIGGTTSSREFERNELYPYADQRLTEFLRERRTEEAVRQHLNATARLAELPDHDPEILIRQLREWRGAATPPPPLMAIRQLIWEDGYRRAALKTHVYADAVRCLRDWFEDGLTLCTFSSRPLTAQELFFEHTRYGDIRPLFQRFFDTSSGAKEDAASYQRITAEVGATDGQTLFLSDSEAELDAAADAGLKTGYIRRNDEESAVDEAGSKHASYSSFDDIRLREMT